MNLPRSSAVLFTVALSAIFITLPAVPAVEAGTVTPLASVPSRYLSLLSTPVSLNAALQAEAKDKQTPAPPEIVLPEGKGKDVTKRVCSGCHGINVFAQQRHTSEKWSSIIDNMVSKGLEASDEDLATINDYLAANLGPPKKDAPTTPPDSSSSH